MKIRCCTKAEPEILEKLAKAIFEAIPGQCKDITPLDGQSDYDMENVYFIGFWTDTGAAPVVEVLRFIWEVCRERKLLFLEPAVWEITLNITGKLKKISKFFIEDDNEYLGAYLCQGKMPISVRDKIQSYEKCRE